MISIYILKAIIINIKRIQNGLEKGNKDLSNNLTKLKKKSNMIIWFVFSPLGVTPQRG